MPDFIQQFDEQALVWIAQNVRCALLDPFMKLYTQLGNTGMLFIVTLAARRACLLFLRYPSSS